jgi:hypothetical protein
MYITKTIVVLAKSIKHGKYCVAGKDINSKEWLRPVSDIKGAELSEQQCKCTNERWNSNPYNCKVLHKIEMKFLQHAPLLNQPENFIVSNEVWRQQFKIENTEIINYLDSPETLWDDEDKLEFALIENHSISIQQSLYLIIVDNLELYMNTMNKRRASFIYKNVNYDLSVTDPNFDNILNNGQNLQNILCVSLGENFNGYCYKIVATIF